MPKQTTATDVPSIELGNMHFLPPHLLIMMLHHGRIIFEGPDELFWKSNDPVIREFVEYDLDPVIT